MATGFFINWPLWLKMGFVLGCLMVIVIGLGFIKLQQRKKVAKKQAEREEEIRARTRELRQSGLVDAQEGEQIPFGIRALESGVEIEGIWISRSNTPVSDTTRLLPGSDRSSDSSGVSTLSDTSQVSQASQQGSRSSSETPMKYPAPFLRRQPRKERRRSAEASSSNDIADSKRRAYKPKRSSHLRFSSFEQSDHEGDAAKETELKASSGRNLLQKKHPSRQFLGSSSIGSSSIDEDAVIDSDQYSGSSSNSANTSANTTSSKGKEVIRGGILYQAVSTFGTDDINSPDEIDLSTFSSSGKPVGSDSSYPASTGLLSSQKSYLGEAEGHVTSSLSSIYVNAGEITALKESQLPLLGQKEPYPLMPTFGPGDIHINRAARKVNSGFEILPAGTFGPHPEFAADDAKAEKHGAKQSMNIQRNSNAESDRHSSKSPMQSPRKLQKKARRAFWRA